MIELFSESPVLLSFILIALAAASFFGWINTGQRATLITAVVFVILLPCLLLLERTWVTDREQIVLDIEELATDLEAERYDQVFSKIDPTVGDALDRAEAELPMYEFAVAKVTGWRVIEVNHQASPPEALADFTVNVVVSRRNLFKDQRVPRRVRIALRKKPEGWRIIGYEHFPPIGDRDAYSTVGTGGEMPNWIASEL